MPETALFDCGEVLSGKPNGLLARGYERPSPLTPAKDDNFLFPAWTTDIAVWFSDAREPLYLFGPTGCGKSSCLRQFARLLNYPVYEITAHSRLEFSELVGHHTVRDGAMNYEYGPLALAMREGGLFLLNEIDLLDPGVAAGLNSVLDGQSLTIAENGGEYIVAHPMFLFAATANSNGASDPSGLYQGVLRQNIAFMDRFFLVESDYSPEKAELTLLRSQFADNLPDETLILMVRYANAVRRLFMGYDAEDMDVELEVTFSTRTLLRWARVTASYVALGQDLDKATRTALWRSLLYRASPTSRITLEELRQRIFG